MVGGGVSVVLAVVVADVVRRHHQAFSHTVHDTLGVVAWALYIGGWLVAIVGLLGYAGSLPLVVNQPERRGRARAWLAAFVVWVLLSIGMLWTIASGLLRRFEGQPKPKPGVLIIEAVLLAGLIALAHGALRAARRRRVARPEAGA